MKTRSRIRGERQCRFRTSSSRTSSTISPPCSPSSTRKRSTATRVTSSRSRPHRPSHARAEFRELRNSFADALAPRLSRITGKAVTRVDMRAYAYRVGHYLLPHSDHQEGLARDPRVRLLPALARASRWRRARALSLRARSQSRHRLDGQRRRSSSRARTVSSCSTSATSRSTKFAKCSAGCACHSQDGSTRDTLDAHVRRGRRPFPISSLETRRRPLRDARELLTLRAPRSRQLRHRHHSTRPAQLSCRSSRRSRQPLRASPGAPRSRSPRPACSASCPATTCSRITTGSSRAIPSRSPRIFARAACPVPRSTTVAVARSSSGSRASPASVAVVERGPTVTCNHTYVSKLHAGVSVVRLVVLLR